MSVKPEPKVIRVVCSLCDLEWNAHGEDPTTENCIRLLKAELAHRPYTNYQYIYQRLPNYPAIGYPAINTNPATSICETRTPRSS